MFLFIASLASADESCIVTAPTESSVWFARDRAKNSIVELIGMTNPPVSLGKSVQRYSLGRKDDVDYSVGGVVDKPGQMQFWASDGRTVIVDARLRVVDAHDDAYQLSCPAAKAVVETALTLGPDFQLPESWR